MGRVWRAAWWLLWVLGAGLLALAAWLACLAPEGGASLKPSGVLELRDGRERHDLWPVSRVWIDPGRQAAWTDVRERPLSGFEPAGPVHANLGRQTGAVWLRASFHVPAGSRSTWLVDVNYPSLDHLDVYLVEAGSRIVLQHTRLGDALPQSQKALPARAHTAELNLTPGGRYDLYLRAQSTSTMVLPVSLVEVHRHMWDETAMYTLQGVLSGVGLALLIYSLAQGWGLREPEYAWYAVSLLGVGGLFVSFFGLGSRFLWGDWVRLNDLSGPVLVLLALFGATNFIDRVLDVRQVYPRVSLALRGAGVVSVLCMGVYAADLMTYPQAQAVSTMLGPLPMVLGVPVAWLRYRQGHRAALYVFIGWGLYSIGVLVMSLLLWGVLPANFWTLHAFQFASMLEMATWMTVLAVRSASLRTAVDQTRSERDQMRRLALTDPLTQVLNRRGLEQQAAALWPGGKAGPGGGIHALFVLDLDGFKAVNDRWGHDVGDALLVEVARRLRHVTRHNDLVARTGGDEFVVVATRLPEGGQAVRIGNKLLHVFDPPLVVEGVALDVSATIGYALAPEDGSSLEVLLKRADIAMYQGKQGGKRRACRYDHATHRSVEVPAGSGPSSEGASVSDGPRQAVAPGAHALNERRRSEDLEEDAQRAL